MIKQAQAVIGAAYGDEGKGLMTDYLAFQKGGAATVVRTNGGAQAGHTVTAPDGRRHVFSHIGSGALAGAQTHLSRFFVSHPMFFLNERESVSKLDGNVEVSADPDGLVTTPYDILINQAVEEARSQDRHGSCGMGFGETIERNLHADLAISIGDLFGSRISIVSKLERIRKNWVPMRLEKLGVTELSSNVEDILKSDNVFRRFMDDIQDYADAIKCVADAEVQGAVIFEGAQGLLLDQDYGAFPHVTRSNTGLRNMVEVAKVMGVDVIETVYMTRAYTTRHGAGPLAHEGTDMSYADVVDPTNKPNDWQGALRLAPLDVDVLSEAIKTDLEYANGKIKVKAKIGISCLDQVSKPTLVVQGIARSVQSDLMEKFVSDASGIDVQYLSYSAHRKNIVEPVFS